MQMQDHFSTMSFNIITNATSNTTYAQHNASMTETKTKYRNDNSITKEIIPSMSSIYNNNDKESKDQFQDTNNTNTATTTRNRIRISISRRRRIKSSALANNITLLSILFICYIVATITNNDFKISMNMLVLVNADETNSTNITTTSTNNNNTTNSTDITNSTESTNQTAAVSIPYQ